MSTGGFGDIDEVLDEDGEVVEEGNDDTGQETDDEPQQTGNSNAEQSQSGQQTEPAQQAQESDSEGSSSTAGDKGGPSQNAAQQRSLNHSPSQAVVRRLADAQVPKGSDSDQRYPYAIQRSGWGDDRNEHKRLGLLEGTLELEEQAAREIREGVYPNTEMSIVDIREAAYLVGLSNLDEVVDVLNEWGFDEADQFGQD